MKTWITHWILTFSPPRRFEKSFSRWLWGDANPKSQHAGGRLGVVVTSIWWSNEVWEWKISVCRGLRPASVGDYCMFGCCKVLVLINAIDHSLMILLSGMLAGVIRVKQECLWGPNWVFFPILPSVEMWCVFMNNFFTGPRNLRFSSGPPSNMFRNAGTNFLTDLPTTEPPVFSKKGVKKGVFVNYP